MQDMSGANVSGDYTVGSTTVTGGISRTVTGSVGSIPTADFFNMQLIEFENVLTAAGDSLNSTVAGDTGKQLINAINYIIEQNINPVSTIVTTATTDIAKLNLGGEWVICDGRELSKLDYPVLYELIGGQYTSTPSSLTFQIPYTIERVIKGTDRTVRVGDGGGVSSVTLELDNVPQHTHISDTMATNPLPCGEGSGDCASIDIGNQETGGVVGLPASVVPFNILNPYISMYQIIRIK